jgi:hypothetical protein
MKKIFPVLSVLAALIVVAIKFLPWWASLILLATGVVGIRWGAKYLLKRVFIIPFKMKGKALSGATVKINDFISAPIPAAIQSDDEEEIDEELQQHYQQLSWYYLDVTITPSKKSEEPGFVCWEPGELMLASMDVKADDLENGFDSDDFEIHDFKVFADGKFAEDEEGKYEGSQRLQLHIGITPGINRFQFRYYFELFGTIGIPANIN